MNEPRFSVTDPAPVPPSNKNNIHAAFDDNLIPEWRDTIAKLGLVPVAVQVTPDWSNEGEAEMGSSIGQELSFAKLGHCDSTQWHPAIRHIFYVAGSRLSEALEFIKSALERRGALSRCGISHFDHADNLWRGFYPNPNS